MRDLIRSFVERATGMAPGNVATSIKAIVGLVVLTLGGIVAVTTRWPWSDEADPRTFSYIAVPPVTAIQYAFPDDNATSSAHAPLSFGTQIEVICGIPDIEGQVTWVQLATGIYQSG